MHDPPPSLFVRDVVSWTDISTEALKAELARRQEDTTGTSKPACGSKNLGEYNTPLHVFALVLILVLSTGACAFPVIVRRYPRLPVPHQFLFLSRHFGTGVLIATAFVHLFPTAYTSLTDPCLPAFWNERYNPMAGLIAMISVLTVVGIEMFFAMRGAGHVHGGGFGDYTESRNSQGYHDHAGHGGGDVVGGTAKEQTRNSSMRRLGVPSEILLSTLPSSSENLLAGQSPSISMGQPSPLPTSSRSAPHEGKETSPFLDGDEDEGDDEEEEEDLDIDIDELTTDAALLNGTAKRKTSNHHHPQDLPRPDEEHNGASFTPSDHSVDQKALLQCLLLEAGILFHSIFIGMALSVSTGPPFAVLLLAISFHQTFEGLALGSRIAALNFPQGSPKPWFMALAYGTTTPIGQAIGLAIHTLYDPASQVGLLTVGIMNAISSGLLLFAGLVELLAEDFLSDHSYVTLRGKRRYQACGSVVAGALLMALVGAWA